MALEYPPQDYYPSAKVRLIVRFDEFGQTTRLKPAPPKITKNLNGVKDDRTPLVVSTDSDAPAGVKRLLLSAANGPGVGAGTDQTKSSDGLTHELGGIIPRSAQWAQNGIRTADTLKCEIKYVDCPIDPRTVRSCAIEYILGCVRAEEYADGIAGKSRPVAKGSPQVESMSLVPDTWTDDNGVQRTNVRFQGWVDKWTIDWGDSGEPVIQLECRDNTSLVIGVEAPPKLVVSAKKPIDEAFATYLSHFPAFQGLSIEYRPSGDAVPVLQDVLSKTAFRPQLGPSPAQGAGSDKHSVWDYLTDLAGSIGHTLRIEGTTIIIQRARSLMSNAATFRQDDPFRGRTLPSGAQFNYRRFIYGRNVLKMQTSRNFAKSVPTNIEVRSYSTAQKTVLVGRFPLPPDRQAYAIPGDAGTDQKWLVVRVAGIEDPKTLRVVAQNIYESIGRNELNVEITTRNLASFGGGNTDPDILDAKPGDSVELLVTRDDDEVNTLTRIENALIAQQRNADFMQQLGFSPEFSSAYSKAYTDAGFQTVFRVKTMNTTWELTQGVTITINGVNYLEVRADKSLASDEEPAPK
jgi:hypothetical protein